MIPKKIYLNEQELHDAITCERMVSCNEPYRDMNEEYVNISQFWHDVNEEPEIHKMFLAQIGDNVFETFLMYVDKDQYWKEWANSINIKRWAYIDDLLPK